MLTLSIRQPYAELILQGVKTVEYRSRATKIIGQPFYIYAARPKTSEEKKLAAGNWQPAIDREKGKAAGIREPASVASADCRFPAPDCMPPMPTGVFVGLYVSNHEEFVFNSQCP